jgi:hypothetical protein
VVVIHGIGGVGKTQLASEYAYRHEHYFSSIFWISGTNSHSIRLSIRDELNRIWLHYQQRPSKECAAYLLVKKFFDSGSPASATLPTPPDEAKLFLEWLSLPKNDKWLLIYDNVDDLETFDIRNFFPRTSQGSIIITSRRLELTTLYRSVNLDILDVADAISLLSKTSALEISKESSGMESRTTR